MKYEIWMEGFALSGEGEQGRAHLHGVQEADSFKEACEKAFEGDSLFNKERLSYWGCGLFDSEAAARKNFG
jgi:hypothetical protein